MLFFATQEEEMVIVEDCFVKILQNSKIKLMSVTTYVEPSNKIMCTRILCICSTKVLHTKCCISYRQTKVHKTYQSRSP